MNKLIKFGLPSALSLMLATPAMALTGYQQGTNPGPHWTNHFQGQGNWGNQSYGENAGRNSGQNSYYGQNGDYGQRGNQWNRGQTYGNNGYNGSNGYASQSQNYSQNGSQNYGENNENSNGQAVSHQFLEHLQRRLQRQGFYHQGNVDGLWGPETESALQNFQQQNNLRPTGQIDMHTLQALNMLNDGNGMQSGQNGQMSGQNGQMSGQNGQTSGQNGQNSQSSQQYGQNGYQNYNSGNNMGGNYSSNNQARSYGNNGSHMGYNEGFNGQQGNR